MLVKGRCCTHLKYKMYIGAVAYYHGMSTTDTLVQTVFTFQSEYTCR